jgi:hypothetical protein
MYTLTSDICLSFSYTLRFSDWSHDPSQGIICQLGGVVLVVGANSLTWWIFATATYLLVFFFKEDKPGRKFELVFLVLWPFVSLFPAVIPYGFYKPNELYGPSLTGQCYFIDPNLIVYIVILWCGLLLLYIVLSYTVLAIYVYYVSRSVSMAIRDKSRMRMVFTLAVSPIIYFLLYIWIIIARLVQLVNGRVSLHLIRFSVGVCVWIGFGNAIWFGYSREIYKKVYEKIFNSETSLTKGTGTGNVNGIRSGNESGNESGTELGKVNGGPYLIVK